MQYDDNDYDILISGYLDGELDAAQRQRVDALLESTPSFRREFEAMRRLVTGTESACSISEPPDEVWDTFYDDIYNRLEHRAGWYLLVSGLALLLGYAAYLYAVEPWATPATKIVLAVPILGLGLLFINVLRHRLNSIKRDRYTREIHR